MRRDAPGTVPLAGLALGGVVAALLAAVLIGGGEAGGAIDSGYVVLPRASAAGPRAAPVAVATPAGRADAASAAQDDAGIWSTPAEFAPPE